MTTARDLDKLGRSHFIPVLAAAGFAHHRGFIFTRKNPCGIYQVIAPQIFISGNLVRLWTHVWVPELEQEYDPSNFPKRIGIGVEFPKWKFEPWDWHDAWDIQTVDAAAASLNKAADAFQRLVLPWFDSIVSGRELVANIPWGKRDDPEMQQVMAQIETNYLKR